MTTPNFDELIGTDVEHGERARLRHVHDLLVTAGPPAELPPELESGPTLAMTLGGRRERVVKRRVMLLAAALIVLALAFFGGYVAGNNGSGGTIASGHTLRLAGTAAAPGALASLRILPVDNAGNLPMKLDVEGLPKLPDHGYYEVYLTRNGKPWAPCGTFVVAGVKHGAVVTLNAPYKLRKHDSWVITRRDPGQHDPGTVVMKPTV